MKKIHIIGIGGIGTSSLARHLQKNGYTVSGSDQSSSSQTEALRKEGIEIFIGQKKENVAKNCDLVIYSPAIPQENEEMRAATNKKIQKMSYPQALGYFFKDTKNICVAGTHGKTTTTAMIGKMLIEAGKDPSIIIGANIKDWDEKNYHAGNSNLTVIESCEYRGSFLSLQPFIVVLTNVDLDHLDAYKDKESYDEAFEKFVKKIPQEGVLIYHEDDESSRKIAEKMSCNKITTEKNFKTDLQIPGKHNQKNAALAAALGKHFRISQEIIHKSLHDFKGTMRRFEYKGIFHHEKGDTKIYDDYGHHPVEIRATLQAAREKFPTEKILVIFQPHQFSRTKFFLEDFGTCFAEADAVLIPNIYEARDATEDKEGISKEILSQKIQETGKKVHINESPEEIKKIAAGYEVVITIGAGNVWKIGESLINKKTE